MADPTMKDIADYDAERRKQRRDRHRGAKAAGGFLVYGSDRAEIILRLQENEEANAKLNAELLAQAQSYAPIRKVGPKPKVGQVLGVIAVSEGPDGHGDLITESAAVKVMGPSPAVAGVRALQAADRIEALRLAQAERTKLDPFKPRTPNCGVYVLNSKSERNADCPARAVVTTDSGTHMCEPHASEWCHSNPRAMQVGAQIRWDNGDPFVPTAIAPPGMVTSPTTGRCIPINIADAGSIVDHINSPEGKAAIAAAVHPYVDRECTATEEQLNAKPEYKGFPKDTPTLGKVEANPTKLKAKVKFQVLHERRDDQCRECGAESPSTRIAGGVCYDCNANAGRAEAARFAERIREIEAERLAALPVPKHKPAVGWDARFRLNGLQ